MKMTKIEVPVGTLITNDNVTHYRSEDVNFSFDKTNGQMVTWGKTFEDDPTHAPFPFILDIEITTKCNGPANKLCGFCSPAGTIVNTPNGDVAIETLKAGDKVWSATSLGTQKPRVRENVIQETYQREFDGELIVIELENGQVLKLTPEHPVMIKGGIEVLAGELKEHHEIIHLSDFQQCDVCHGPVTSSNRYKRFYCSEKCQQYNKGSCCLICGEEFIGKRKNQKFCSGCVDYGSNSHHPLMNVYSSMLYRCYNPERNNYKYYGAKGITVHDDWLSFDNFVNDMMPTYKNGLELERIDGNEQYSKDNCTWMTKHEQRQHRSIPKNSNNVYKCVTKHKTCFSVYLPTSEHDGSKERIGSLGSAKEAVDLYNQRMMELYPETYTRYIQEYKGEY